MKRESGYYFVKKWNTDEWIIGYYHSRIEHWELFGKTLSYHDYDFQQIDENQIKRAEDD